MQSHWWISHGGLWVYSLRHTVLGNFQFDWERWYLLWQQQTDQVIVLLVSVYHESVGGRVVSTGDTLTLAAFTGLPASCKVSLYPKPHNLYSSKRRSRLFTTGSKGCVQAQTCISSQTWCCYWQCRLQQWPYYIQPQNGQQNVTATFTFHPHTCIANMVPTCMFGAVWMWLLVSITVPRISWLVSITVPLE